ncbi:E-selectin-like [Diadema antillarum]|uniref:E-selectin-like n=1 Tax=Diadema antillarum TaxID=105358 RepID=UPI003A8A50CE
MPKDYGTKCQFSCNTGYEINNDEVTCTAQAGGTSARWVGATPVCSMITCPSDDLLAPDHGRKVGCSNDREDYGTSCTLACEDGYEPKTSVSKTCSDDGDGDGEGVWTGNDIVCTIVTCPALTPPANGAISQCSFMGVVQPTTSTSQNYSAVCTTTCHTGFNITPPVITCPLDVELIAKAGTTSATVQWANMTQPLATDRETVISTHVFSIDSVQVEGNTSSLPTSLTEGDHTVVHRAVDSAGNSATCSHNVRVREPKTCPGNFSISYGSVTPQECSGMYPVLFDTTCSFVCDDGFRLEGPGDIVCSIEGLWSYPSAPTCIDIQPPNFNSSCPSEIRIFAHMGSTSSIVNFQDPIASDNSGNVHVSK